MSYLKPNLLVIYWIMLSVHTEVKPSENSHTSLYILWLILRMRGPLYYTYTYHQWDPKEKLVKPNRVGLCLNKQTV